MKPLYSIIVPIYNSELYLEKLIKSILEQSFKEFELILVNDGSTDNSLDICNKYGQFDSRIRIESIKNSGVAEARNYGINLAKGTYILFVDSDDWIEKDSLLEYSYLLDNDALVIFGFNSIYEFDEKQIIFPLKPQRTNLTKNEFYNIFPDLLKRNLIATPWNKVYKLSIIKGNNISFPNVANEDIYFNMDYLNAVNKIKIADKNLYNWNRGRIDSETSRVLDHSIVWDAKKSLFYKILSSIEDWDITESGYQQIYSYYTERMILIAQIMVSKNTKFNVKIRDLNLLLNDSLSVESLDCGKSDSKIMNLALFPFKIRRAYIVYIEIKILSFLQETFDKEFIKIKSRLVNRMSEAE